MTTDTLAPIEAEAGLLGMVMNDPMALERAADRITAADFALPLHARIWSALLHEASCGRPANPVTIRNRFEDDPDIAAVGGPVYLMQLLTMPEANMMSPRHMVDHLADMSDRRRMREGLAAAVAACADTTVSTASIASLADSAITARAESSIVESDAAEAMKAALASFDAGVTGTLSKRVIAADDILGPLEPKSLTIVAARPGMGKTAFCSSYAIGAAECGHGVLFVSLEMSREQLAGRMIADVAFDDPDHRVPYVAIQRRNLNEWQRRRVGEVAGRIACLPITIIDAGSLTIGRLDMLVRRYRRRMAAQGTPLGLVIVDYLQLLHPDERMKSAYETASEISKRLKGIAKDHDVPVMALAQLSRGIESRPDKRPLLSDLRDSGQIEQDADTVMFLLREEYYLMQSEPQNDPEGHAKWEAKLERCRGTIDFIVAKQRHGTTGTARGRFFGPYQAVR